MGVLAAENILEGAQHDLWAVNTDTDVSGSGDDHEVRPRTRSASNPRIGPRDGRSVTRNPHGHPNRQIPVLRVCSPLTGSNSRRQSDPCFGSQLSPAG